MADLPRSALRWSSALLLACVCACTPTSATAPQDSLSEMLRDPAAFSDQRVVVSGFLLVSWEGGGLFRTPAEEESYETENAIRLLVPTKTLGPLDHYDGTFGAVTGVFEFDTSHGWSGTIVLDEIEPRFRFRPLLELTPAQTEGSPEDRLRDEVLRSVRDDIEKRSNVQAVRELP